MDVLSYISDVKQFFEILIFFECIHIYVPLVKKFYLGVLWLTILVKNPGSIFGGRLSIVIIYLSGCGGLKFGKHFGTAVRSVDATKGI